MTANNITADKMFRFNSEMLNSYLENDRILKYLQSEHRESDNKFMTHQWLLDMPPKRLIYDKMYPELFTENKTSLKILDVGGGYSSLTRQLSKNNNYTLLDIMVHDDKKLLKKISKDVGFTWIDDDWFNFKPQINYDLVIANDLFPNADQRLDLFIKKYLPFCKFLRLSITCYNIPKFYKAQRMSNNYDEVLFIQAWDGAQTKRVLSSYADCVVGINFDEIGEIKDSLFKNGRQVYSVTLKRDID